MSRPLTSPCLRRLRSHTRTLPGWTAPSPPPAAGGSWVGREGAWGRAVQAAGAQTAAEHIQTPQYPCLTCVFADVPGKQWTKLGLIYDHREGD